MGKCGRKWKESVPAEVVFEAIESFPVSGLMPAAKVVCGTDYSVRYYYNKRHPKFYRNEEAFRKALTRCVSVGVFDHRAIVIRMLSLCDNDGINS